MPFKKPHHTSDPSYRDKRDDGGYDIKPRGLNIVWGNDSRYWRIPDHGPAELIQVSWLEVSHVVPIKRNGIYSIKFYVTVKEDGFGWDETDVLVMAKLGKTGKYIYKSTKLTPGEQSVIPAEQVSISVENLQEGASRDLYFGLYEVWSGKWKGGLEIHRAEVVRREL